MKKSTILSICIWTLCIGLWTHTYMKSDDPNPVIQHDICTKNTLSMQVQIEPYFDEFIKDCEIYGVPDDHIYCLRGIGFDEDTKDNGYTDYTDRVIRLNPILLTDTAGMRFVLYHEFGHWLGLRHSTGIMKDSYSASSSEWTHEHWDELKEEYFDRLKE